MNTQEDVDEACLSEGPSPFQNGVQMPIDDGHEPKEGWSLKEEMKLCFYEWTQHQSALVESLSVRYTNQLDETCQKILTALKFALKEESAPAGWMTSGQTKVACGSSERKVSSAESEALTEIGAFESYQQLAASSAYGCVSTEADANFSMKRSLSASKFHDWPGVPPAAGQDQRLQRPGNSLESSDDGSPLAFGAAFGITKSHRVTAFAKARKSGTDMQAVAVQSLETMIRPEVMNAWRTRKTAKPATAEKKRQSIGRTSMVVDITQSWMPSKVRTSFHQHAGVSIPVPNVMPSEINKRRVPFSMQKSSEDIPGLLNSVVGGPRGKKRWDMFGSVVSDVVQTLPPEAVDQLQQEEEDPLLQKCVRSTFFDLVCAFVIILFMISLGIETNDTVRRGGEGSKAFFIISLCFNAWFTLELMLRIAAERCEFFVGEDMFLNIMDVCLVLTSVADLILGVLLEDRPAIGLDTDVVSRFMRVIRVLRAVRIVRLARVMRYIYQLRKMVCLIQGCFTTLFWCLMIMVAFVYTFAVLFTQGVTDYIFQSEWGEGSTPAHIEKLHKHYGSVEKSMNSLFQSMSTGVSWGMVFDPLTETGWLYPSFFMVFVTLSLFGVLNVMTSVFVESTMKSALAYRDLIITDSERSKQIAIRHLNEVFRDIDIDGNGTLSLEEVMFFLADANVYTYMEALDINLHDARTLFQLIDTDSSGEVDIDEFCDGCLRLKGTAKAFDVHCLICELSRFFDKWSMFTEFVVRKFESLEAREHTPRVVTKERSQASRQRQTESLSRLKPTVLAL